MGGEHGRAASREPPAGPLAPARSWERREGRATAGKALGIFNLMKEDNLGNKLHFASGHGRSPGELQDGLESGRLAW